MSTLQMTVATLAAILACQGACAAGVSAEGLTRHAWCSQSSSDSTLEATTLWFKPDGSYAARQREEGYVSAPGGQVFHIPEETKWMQGQWRVVAGELHIAAAGTPGFRNSGASLQPGRDGLPVLMLGGQALRPC
ncbi:conserved exported hypothetical protein [Rubrivivax sp. A210]|uniref:hypothetical protein n=1 Tax=Rubrivivax sp. A210 TaxID=2772301 RepID=UPI001919781E|nr:hypothetical protein [Rubrivivax sp. A210]CAD5375072.1 conserved exported hypothetical protein [Rubrivivax sp. A210]